MFPTASRGLISSHGSEKSQDISILRKKIRAFSSTGALLNRETVDLSAADASQIRFRQDPGSRNALGLVRIDMPNDDIVYMHDTPMKQLFDQQQRAFSAGCVRVQEVFELATWIAALENGWQEPGGVQRILDGGQSQTVKLARQIPVYFSYLTAWAEGDGMAVFRPDIYGRDGQHIADHGPYSATVLPPQGLAP